MALQRIETGRDLPLGLQESREVRKRIVRKRGGRYRDILFGLVATPPT
jgi:hypothetical protein